MIKFACIAPHPPIILPSVGSPQDRAQVKNTIEALKKLGEKLSQLRPDKIIISSPHPDWGIKVPLHFLSSKLQLKIQNYQNPDEAITKLANGHIYPILTTLDSPKQHYQWGKKFYQSISQKPNSQKVALIASGDLSHCLKEEGPYGFHPDGPKFDQNLIELLKKKDVEKILKLNELYPAAGECGLRSFCFVLGILEASKILWQPKILSYQAPFGVGYLVADFELNRQYEVYHKRTI